jgi:uncharacterized protein (TIGR03437 family)
MIARSRSLKRAAVFAAAALLAGVPAEAYYHYVYYYGASYAAMAAKFDLSKLPNSTVTFYVNDSGPANLAPGDTFGSVLGEVKQALAAWNSVPTSALRIAFGGLENANQSANTPGGQVIFQDLGPGVLGLGTPQLPAAWYSNINYDNLQTPFLPISHSLVILTNNTNANSGFGPGPSYLEAYFTTAVHEIGHALGLQHTWTGSAMSQGVIRDTSRARPLDADDIASLSELYGAPGWKANYGSIQGTVRYNNGQGVSLASVVAIAPTGAAVSALTNPDGTYIIDGLPPNTYNLYVHPLPPDALQYLGEGLQLPQGQNGVFQPSQTFHATFAGGTIDPTQALTFVVTPGSVLNASNTNSNTNFTVTPTSGVPAYDLITYSYLDPGAGNYTETPPSSGWINPTPAFVNSTQQQVLVYAVANAGPTAQAQTVDMMGVGNATVQTTAGAPGMFLYFNLPGTPSVGPRHLVFEYGNDMYVLPNAVNFVQQGPPYIASANPNGDGTVTLTGTGFGPDSRVFFDGLPAFGSFNAAQGSLTVTPPSGMSGQTSTLTVFGSDSQNSMFLLGIDQGTSPNFQQQTPQTYTYPSSASPLVQTVTPAALPAGFASAPYTALVDITGVNTHFIEGQVTVGFGTSDVTVSRVWVLSPTHLQANAVVAPGAAIGSSEISVISGFNVAMAPVPFQIQPANTTQALIGTVVNGLNTQTTLYPAIEAVAYGLNLAAGLGSVQATLNGAPINVVYASSGQVNFVIPPGFPTGPATLSLSGGSGSISLVVPVANQPVTIAGVSNANGPTAAASAAPNAPAIFNPGDTVSVQVNGLDPSVASNLSRVQVTVSGIGMPVVQAGNNQVQFVLTRSFGSSAVPVVVLVDGSPSAAFSIAVR